MTPAPTRVVVVDDHPMVAEGIEAILESYDDIDVIATLSDGQSMIDQLDSLSPDVILMDLNMPGLGGLSATEMILERRPATRILILSMHDSPEYISTALSHGARGYVLKDVPTDEIKRAIDVVMGGAQYLCPGAEGALGRCAVEPIGRGEQGGGVLRSGVAQHAGLQRRARLRRRGQDAAGDREAQHDHRDASPLKTCRHMACP